MKRPSDDTDQPIVPKLAKEEDSQSFVSFLSERKGERDEMQDRHDIQGTYQLDIKDLSKSAFFGLYDGHAGHRAAELCAQKISSTLRNEIEKVASQDISLVHKFIRKIFINTFKIVDDEFLARARQNKPQLRDGSTVTVVLLLDKILFCANIGDSKAVVGRVKEEGVVTVNVTEEHCAMSFEERQRITKAGGFVKDGRLGGISEVSRAIGDASLKSQGMISTPSVKKVTLTDNDKFVIIACDGLWKAFTEQEIVEKVWAGVKDKYPVQDSKAWSDVAENLASDAVLKGSGDNVTVLIVPLS